MENNKKMIEEMNVENKIELNDQELENANGAGLFDKLDRLEKLAKAAKDAADAVGESIDVLTNR